MIKVHGLKILILLCGPVILSPVHASVSKSEKARGQTLNAQAKLNSEVETQSSKEETVDPISAPLKAKNYKALKQQVDSLRRHLEIEYQKAKRELDSSPLRN